MRSMQLNASRRQLVCRDRIKGQILQMIFQKHFPAELKKKEFFYRWRVRCNIIQPRNVINRLVLYARIQPEIAYWRLRNLIKNPYDDHIIGNKLVKFEKIIDNTKISFDKKFLKIAFFKLLQNLRKQKLLQRLCEQFERKMNKLLKKIGFRTIKQNQFDFLMNSKFVEGLNQFAKKKIIIFLQKLREKEEQGEEKKKRAGKQVINSSIDNTRRILNEWKRQTNQDKQYLKCRLVMKFMETMNREIIVNTLQVFQSNREQILKTRAIERMFGNFNQYARKLLNQWRVNAKFGTLNREMVSRMIQNLGQQVKSGERGKLRQGLNQFYVNMKIKKVQLNFFKSLLDTKSGQMLKIFRIWKEIPSRFTGPANKFQIKLQTFSQRRLRTFYDSMKELVTEAENKKKRALQTLFLKTQASYKRFYVDWKQMMYTDNMIRRCKMTIALFEKLEQTIQSNTQFIFQDDTVVRKMTAVVEKMVEQWKKKNYKYFYQWRKINQNMRMEELMNDQVKKDMLNQMVSYIKKSSGNSYRMALRQFYTHYRVKLIQQKVFNKLLDTSAGKIVHIFTIWKSLPPPTDNDLKIRSVKFERMLHNLAYRPMKRSFQAFSEIYQEAASKKNQFLIVLLNKTMSNHKRMFINWSNTTRTMNHQLKCRLTINLFNFINENITKNVNTIVEHNRVMQSRIKAIERLINNFKKYKIIAFQKWIAYRETQIAEEEVEDELVKRNGIQKLEGVVQETNDTRLSSVLEQFRKFVRQERILIKLFRNIDRVQTNNANNLFLRWRSVPDRSFPLESNLFQQKLGSRADKIVRSMLDRMREIYKEGEDKKKSIIIKFIENQRRNQRDAFQRINSAVEQRKRILQVNRLEQAFFMIQNAIQNNVMPLLENDRQAEIKKKFLLKLIHNQNLNVGRAYNHWWNYVLFTRLGDEKKKMVIDMLNRFTNNSERTKLRQALKQFYTHGRIDKIKRQFIDKILDTGAGKLVTLFRTWKFLPKITNAEEKVKAMKFQIFLHNLSQQRLRSFLNPMKNFLEESEMKKKKAMITLLDRTMSNHKRLFLSWRNLLREHNQFTKCRLLIQFFEFLNGFTLSQTLQPLQNNRQQQVVEKVVFKMMNNRNQQLRDFLMRWKSKVQWEHLTGERYQQILRRMVDSLKSNQNIQFRQVLSQFNKNKRIKEVQIAFFKQLFNTGAGQTMTVLRKWQSIPSRTIGPANQFQIILQRFTNSRQRQLISTLKDFKHEADQKKQKAIQALINMTMSSNKRFFIDWKNMIATDRVIRRCHQTINLFESLQDILIQNTAFLLKSDRDRYLMQNAIQRLVNQTSQRGLRALRQWRQAVQLMVFNENSTKREMLQRMQENLRNNGNFKYRQILSKFYLHFKIEKIKHKVFDTLLATSSGKLLKVFLTWKGLPSLPDDEERRKCIAFESVLNRIIQRPKKSSFNCFTNIFHEAEGQKKRFMQNLLNKTMSSHKRMFLSWASMSDDARKFSKCKKTMILFDIMNNILTERAKFALFDSIPEYQKKIQMLRKLIDNYQRLRKEFWLRWQNQVQSMKQKDEQKGDAIMQLKDLLEDKVKRQAKQALQSFDADKKLQKIAFNLYKRLGVTSNNIVLQLFLKWKYLPYRPPKNASHQFEEKLCNLAINRNRSFIDSLKQMKLIADEKKKNLIGLLMQGNKSKIQQVYDAWTYKKEDIAIQKCQKTISFFDLIQQKLNQQFGVIVESRNWDLMAKYLQKLVDLQNGNIKQCLKQWKQYVFDSKIDLETKRRIIEKLTQMKQGSTISGQRTVLNQFMKNRNILKIQHQFFGKLLDTTVGKTLTLFTKWKALPIIVPGSEKVKSQMFERILNEFSGKRLRQFFDPLKKSLTEGLIIKKDSLYRLINLTMSDHKRLFIKWANYTKQYQQNSKCRATLDLFARLNEKITENLKISFENERENNIRKRYLEKLLEEQRRRTSNAFSTWSNLHRSVKQAEKCKKTIDFFEHVLNAMRSKMELVFLNQNAIAIKTKTLEKLVQISKGNTEKAFRQWYQYMVYNRLDDASKRKMIDMLKRTIGHSKNNYTREALKSFKKNASIKRYQQQFFSKLLSLKVGQQMLCFQKWKSLPIPINFEERRRYASFQQKMANVFTNPLKKSLEVFKDIKYNAEITKKKALYLLLKKTMGIPQKLFIKWRNVTQDDKRLDLWNAMNQLFENLNNKIVNNLENTILEKTGTATHNQKIQKLVILFQRVQGLYKRTLNDSMHMIQRKSGSVALRAYFASLWKWKFANLDAKYYMKYKQIYRQSAVLSRFVQIVHSKIVNNLQLGFTGIKNPRNKYYKLMSCIRIREREEVKLQAAGLNAWRQNISLMKYQQNLMTVMIHQKLTTSMSLFSRLLKQGAMNRIKSFVFTVQSKKAKEMSNFFILLQERGNSARQRQLQQAFEAIKNYSNTNRLYSTIKGLIKLFESNTIKNRILKHAFDAIYDSAYDQNVNVWERRTFQYMVGLADISTSFNVLKNLAFPQLAGPSDSNSPPSPPPSSNQRTNLPQPPKNPQPQSRQNQRNNQSPSTQNNQQQQQNSASSTISRPQRQPPPNILTPSIIIAHELITPCESQIIPQIPMQQSQVVADNDNSLSGILNQIGQENLQVINRLGAADHINSILSAVLIRHKSSIFRQLFARSTTKTVIELKFEQQQKQTQINDLVSQKKKLEGQLTSLERNSKQQESRIQLLGDELNQAIEQSEILLQQSNQKEREKFEQENLIEQLKKQQLQQQQQIIQQQKQQEQLVKQQQILQEQLNETQAQSQDKVKRSSRHDNQPLPQIIINNENIQQGRSQPDLSQAGEDYYEQNDYQQHQEQQNQQDELSESQTLEYQRIQQQNIQIKRRIAERLFEILQRIQQNNMGQVFEAYHHSIDQEYERKSLEEEQNDYMSKVSDVQQDLYEIENKISNLLAQNEQAEREHQEIIDGEEVLSEGDVYGYGGGDNLGYSEQQNPSQVSLRIRLQYADQPDSRQPLQQQQQQQQYYQSPPGTGRQFRNDGSYSGRQYNNPYMGSEYEDRDQMIEDDNYQLDQSPLSRVPDQQLLEAVDELQYLNSQMQETLLNQLNRKFNDLRARRIRYAFNKIKNEYYQSN